MSEQFVSGYPVNALLKPGAFLIVISFPKPEWYRPVLGSELASDIMKRGNCQWNSEKWSFVVGSSKSLEQSMFIYLC